MFAEVGWPAKVFCGGYTNGPNLGSLMPFRYFSQPHFMLEYVKFCGQKTQSYTEVVGSYQLLINWWMSTDWLHTIQSHSTTVCFSKTKERWSQQFLRHTSLQLIGAYHSKSDGNKVGDRNQPNIQRIRQIPAQRNTELLIRWFPLMIKQLSTNTIISYPP